MTWKIIEAWQVFTTLNEHGGKGASLGFMETKAGAQDFAKGKGDWGGMGIVEPVRLVRVGQGGNVRLFPIQAGYPDGIPLAHFNADVKALKEKARLEAVAKAQAALTPEELKLIGAKIDG